MATSEKVVCPVCLYSYQEKTVGRIDSCGHEFCLECILKWGKESNVCPVDRESFEYVNVLHEGKDLGKMKVKCKKRKCIERYDFTSHCEVCDDVKETDLLLCDACNLAYHPECLTPPLTRIPRGLWYCPVCYPIIRSKPSTAKAKKPQANILGEGTQTQGRQQENDGSTETPAANIKMSATSASGSGIQYSLRNHPNTKQTLPDKTVSILSDSKLPSSGCGSSGRLSSSSSSSPVKQYNLRNPPETKYDSSEESMPGSPSSTSDSECGEEFWTSFFSQNDYLQLETSPVGPVDGEKKETCINSNRTIAADNAEKVQCTNNDAVGRPTIPASHVQDTTGLKFNSSTVRHTESIKFSFRSDGIYYMGDL